MECKSSSGNVYGEKMFVIHAFSFLYLVLWISRKLHLLLLCKQNLKFPHIMFIRAWKNSVAIFRT